MPHPLAVEHLPDIDPREHALESRSWGEEFAFHLVRYDGRYYAWTVRPFDDGDHAYEMPSQDAARRFLDAEFAFLLTSTEWGERSKFGIIPIGPELDWTEPHGRARLSS